MPPMPEMPDMPAMPSMPDMPSMNSGMSMPDFSIPGFENGFYKPSMPNNSGKTDTKAAKQTGDLSLTDSVLTDATSSDDLLSMLMGNKSTLTAKDISSLYDSGLFTNVSSLGTSDITSAQQNTTNILLQKVLTELSELKAEQKKASAAQKESLQDTQTDSQTFKKREPSILRFKINGYDMTDSLTTVFFSEPEADGTFLLTADRKYFADNKARTETFYILFNAVKNTGATLSYELQPSVVQDYENKNSFIYRFANIKHQTAEKTGNLVVVKTTGDLNVDLLLKIDR